jgi:hypothetical protein
MRYKATNPARVSDKIKECRFFLVQTAEHEKAQDTEKFMFCLSAFLSSFRTAVYRLIGVVHKVSGKVARDSLRVQLESKTDIWFLKDRTDLEVHGDGAIVWPRYTMSTLRSMHDSYANEWPHQRFRSRFEDRFRSRFRTQNVKVDIEYWYFDGHHKNLIELCGDSLEELERIFRKELS